MREMGLAIDLEILLQHGEFLTHLARGLVDDESAADDLEQDVWLALLARRTDSAPGERVRSWRAWMTRVAQNLASNRRRSESRRSKREADANPPAPLLTPDEISKREELRRRVVTALFTLEEPYLSTVLYRYYEELPPSEIARQLDVSVETVKTRLRRGIATLRAELDREFGGRSPWLHAFVPLLGGVPATSSTTGSAILSWLGVFMSFKKVAILLIAALGLFWYATRPSTESPLAQGSDTRGVPAAIVETPPGEGVETTSNSDAGSSDAGSPNGSPALDRTVDAIDRVGSRVHATGTVTYPDGDPVEEIQIAVYQVTRHATGVSAQEMASAETDVDGAFTLTNVPEGPIELQLEFADSAYQQRIELESIAELPNPIVIDRHASVFLDGRIVGGGAPPTTLKYWLLRPNGERSGGNVPWQ